MKNKMIIHDDENYEIELYKTYNSNDGNSYIHVGAMVMDKETKDFFHVYSHCVHESGSDELEYNWFGRIKLPKESWEERVDKHVQIAREAVRKFLERANYLSSIVQKEI